MPQTGGTSAEISPQDEGGWGTQGAALANVFPTMEAGGNSEVTGVASPAAPSAYGCTLSQAVPTSALVAAGTPRGSLAGEANTTTNVEATTADRGPFGIFPGFAVVPANGEVSFEVVFSPATLGEAW